MVFNINDSTKIDHTLKPTYSYSNITVNTNQIKHTLNTDGILEVPFTNNNANIIIDGKPYKSTNLYVIKSRNLIQTSNSNTDYISYDAELIIEHSPMTNDTSNKLYTCFLLKYNTDISNTSIDTLLTSEKNPTNSTQISFSLNTNRGSQVYYTDNNGKQVIIFTNIIEIQTQISLPTPNNNEAITLFSTNTSNYSILPIRESFTTVVEGFTQPIIEGLTKTAYCQPIDMIDASGAEDANLTIPLTGAYTPNSATNSITRTAINFMSFVMVLLFTYVMVPIIYNDYIVGLITMQGQSKMNRIRSIDVYICFVFVMATFALITQGINNNNQNSTIMGFFVGLFFVIGFVTIQTKKIDSSWFSKNFPNEKSDANSLYAHVSILDDFIKFIYENFSIFISNIFIGAVILFILLGFGYITGSFKSGGLLSSGDGVIYLVLFIIYLTIAVSQIKPR